jgi:hypothetical protein
MLIVLETMMLLKRLKKKRKSSHIFNWVMIKVKIKLVIDNNKYPIIKYHKDKVNRNNKLILI